MDEKINYEDIEYEEEAMQKRILAKLDFRRLNADTIRLHNLQKEVKSSTSFAILIDVDAQLHRLMRILMEDIGEFNEVPDITDEEVDK